MARPLTCVAVVYGQVLPGVVFDDSVILQDIVKRDAICVLETDGAQHPLAFGKGCHGLYALIAPEVNPAMK